MKRNREKQSGMEQQQSSIDDWSEKEMQVAQILAELPLIWEDRPSLAWGCTKKRSAIHHALYLSSKSVPAVVKIKNDAAAAAAVTPGSPASPLSLSRTESDEKLKTKPSYAIKKESYLRIIQDLTKTKNSLYQELDNVKRHCAQLKDFNFRLRQRRRKLSNNDSESEESKNPNLENGVNSSSMDQDHNNKRPRCQPSTTSLALSSSSSLNADGGPLPDLNLTFDHVDSCEPSDMSMVANEDSSSSSKAMAAQICRLKAKKFIGSSSKSQFSYR